MQKEEEDWNWEAIEGWISNEKKELVRQIMINDKNGGDKFVWTKEKCGEYSVKTGYKAMRKWKEMRLQGHLSYKVDRRI